MSATTGEYEKLLKAHDWTFEYSDDGRVHKKGLAERGNLDRLQKTLDPEATIWNQHCPPDYRK